MYEDIKGTWTFYETDRVSDSAISCEGNTDPTPNKVKITLEKLNTAVDEFGNAGTWTIIYNQGFEITVNERTYFAFSKYAQVGDDVTSYCGETLFGWSHDVTSRNWACFRGYREEGSTVRVEKRGRQEPIKGVYQGSGDFVDRINAAQKSWTAKKYEMFEGKTHEELLNMQGGRGSRVVSRPKPAAVKPSTKRRGPSLPKEFDWRNVDGVNYVPEVRDQGNCGSCYIFGSLGMLESRVRIMTGNTKQPIFSPQHLLSCSPYSQGCNGGFPYLTAGKYAKDFGLVDEECVPYEAKDLECMTTDCSRHYVARFSYVGGYYGACNEQEMKQSLVDNGPMVVGFEVYPDFKQYSGGIYHHTGLTDGFNPFELTNHAVLIVGYGTDAETGEDYWTVMNSWGKEWGVDGFFKIRRGTDECGIESIAVNATPIP